MGRHGARLVASRRGQLVAAIGFWIVTPRRYLPGWNRREAGGILRLGLPLAASNLVVFATLNLDYVVVGRLLDPVALGLYLMAFNLASLPSTVVNSIVRTVAVPAFGRLHAVGRLPMQAVRVVRGLSFAAFPLSALLIGLAVPLMVTLFGERWAPAAAAMLGLGVFGMARILTELFADLCVGAGRTGGLFWVQVVWFAALAPALWVGVSLWGIAGAGYAHAAVAWFVVVPVYLLLVRRGVGASPALILRACVPPALGALVCAVVAAAVAATIAVPILAVLAGGAAGVLAYLVATLPIGAGYLLARRTRTRETAASRPHEEVAT
ncbi:oligosaccharide flippase family protein [Agromyces ramosus]|uniref:O-antigen/teichoic acid export membrane protein n=1 Tax=Agromyces ramosus TaxID=33879 RepID=A0ABU0R864_9MICO|nr:oligosaccharide flippase family protein [Agromyces ramosus]MDQ0894275.1 O-antigen/teichoic acid export membrane protein [Agromyces ramosus]